MDVLNSVKNNKRIKEFIKESDKSLRVLGYTDHGERHIELVSERAMHIAREAGLLKREVELCGIAGFCHDMGNFMGRTEHHYWGALLFEQVFGSEIRPQDLAVVMQAIANHDKFEMKFTSPVSAILVLADKSDVSRDRVRRKKIVGTPRDIHERVNYGTLSSGLTVDNKTKRIVLNLKIDTKFVPVIEYFEIFTERMSYCRLSAEYLGYQFGLIINNFKLA